MTPHVERHFTVGDAMRGIVVEMGKEFMSQRSMMKRVNGMEEKSADLHKEHQQEHK